MSPSTAPPWESEGPSAPQRTAAPGRTPPPADTTPPSPPAQRAATPQPPQPSGFGVTDLRRIWPDVLEDVKGRRRVTWILLSQNAQVVDVRDGTLTLGLANQGVRENFVRGTHSDLLREALHQVTGLTLHIEPIVDANAADAATTTAPASSAPAPTSFTAPPLRSAGAQEAREQLRRGRSTPSPAEPEAEPSRDDASLDDEISSDELLIQHLGAQLIEEQDT